MERIRKQLYPLGTGNYPTLVQKFFNGSETWPFLFVVMFKDGLHSEKSSFAS